MKKEQGITLVALVTTIVILLILSTIGINVGTSTYENAEFKAFISELKIMQTQVNEWNQKYLNGDKTILDLGKELTGSETEKISFSGANITDTIGYRYFDKQTISNIGLEGIKREFLINIEQRMVICYGGYTYEEKTYYTINQLPNSIYNVDYTDKTSGNITVGNVYVASKNENSWEIYIEDIKYPQYIAKGKIEYQKKGSNTWNLVEDNKFTVTEPGIYYIRITDAGGNTKIVNSSGEEYIDNKIPVYIYVKEGLILDLDGTQNTRSGRQSDTNIWEDLSGNYLDANLNNFNMTAESGWQKNSLSFDGIDDYGSINNNELLKMTNQTIEVLIKKKKAVNNDRSIFFVKWPGYTMEFNPTNEITYGRANNEYLHAKTKTTFDKLYSIVGTHNNNTSTIFINGLAEGEEIVTPINFNDNNLTIGNHHNKYFLNGEIYQIRMYNRCLTEDERKINYEIDKERYKIE